MAELPRDQSIVIFGASGDLTSRKLIPALFALHRQGRTPSNLRIVGYSRTELTDEAFRERMREAVADHPGFDADAWDTFADRLHYVPGTFSDPSAMAHLERALEERSAPSPYLFYCATPPSAFPDIVRRLGEEGLQRDARIVIEKPFGHDLASAQELNACVHEVFDEEQIFRIDHYLGKETVMNILVLRFANGMFEPIWNRRYVSRLEITVAEDEGIGTRGGFYEEAGALRDIVQNHIFQVLTFLAMEPPVCFEPGALRTEKAKVLQALRPVDPRDVVRGQYTAADGMRGYTDEDGVPAGSRTETFAAMRLWIDDWRWAGVPIYVRTGKRLPRRVTEVTMTFQDAPHRLFDERPEPNHLTIRIQPDEGICLTFDAKTPGPRMDVRAVDMDFSYADHFQTGPPEAYERLLWDAMKGDASLFPRADEVEFAWRVLEPVLRQPPPVHPYAAGTWGPQAADELIAPAGWHVS